MPPKQVEIKIEGLDEEGRGVGLWQGKPVALPFTVPGETVRLNPRLDPNTLEIKTPSPDRVVPPCPYFGSCGGCSLQHMSYERQLAEKFSWLCRLADRAGIDAPIRPVIASPQAWNYRRRVQFQAGPRGEIGFFGFKNQKVVGIEECRIAQEPVNRAIPRLKELAAEVLASPRRATLLSFEVTVADGGEVEIGAEAGARSFLQVNPAANRELISFLGKTLESLQPGRVLELFAGEGNLTFPLAGLARHWTAVESNAAAVRKAKLVPSAGPVIWKEGDARKILLQTLKKSESWDAVLLDPPREGAKDVVSLIRELAPAVVLYVSCNPKTLFRDLAVLRNKYRVETVQPFDFFPQTMHLESAAVLRKIS